MDAGGGEPNTPLRKHLLGSCRSPDAGIRPPGEEAPYSGLRIVSDIRHAPFGNHPTAGRTRTRSHLDEPIRLFSESAYHGRPAAPNSRPPPGRVSRRSIPRCWKDAARWRARQAHTAHRSSCCVPPEQAASAAALRSRGWTKPGRASGSRVPGPSTAWPQTGKIRKCSGPSAPSLRAGKPVHRPPIP